MKVRAGLTNARPPPLLDEERRHAQRERGENMHTHHPHQDDMLTRGFRTPLMHMPAGTTCRQLSHLVLQPCEQAAAQRHELAHGVSPDLPPTPSARATARRTAAASVPLGKQGGSGEAYYGTA